MLNTRISAIFNSKDEAERAVKELRRQGVADDHISVISQHSAGAQTAAGAGGGALAGAGVGAIFGLSAALIPGIGPFIAAGFLAPALGAIGGATAAGAIVGGTAGMIAGALSRAGYSKKESEFYGKELENGRTLLAVDAGAAMDQSSVASTIAQHGGRQFNPGGTTATAGGNF